MDQKEPIKAVCNEFTKEPFYLIQKNGSHQRYVVAFQKKELIKTFLTGFVKNGGANITSEA